jgi:hypothetical protein
MPPPFSLSFLWWIWTLYLSVALWVLFSCDTGSEDWVRMHAATFLRKNGAGLPVGFRALGLEPSAALSLVPKGNTQAPTLHTVPHFSN